MSREKPLFITIKIKKNETSTISNIALSIRLHLPVYVMQKRKQNLSA